MTVTLTPKIQAYVKLSKPKIVYLLDLAAIAGAALGIKGFLAGRLVISILLMLIGGSLAAAGAGMVNEGLEVDRDKLMKRTSWRPTVSGKVSRNEAILVGSLMVGIGTLVGLLDNVITSLFILLGALIYIFVYTIWLKPRTSWNIVIGGFAGSAAAWAGYASVTGRFDLASFLLGLLIFMWTPGHFWSLALKMKEDYRKAGYPMLPVRTTERRSAIYIAVSNILMLPVALSLTVYAGLVYGLITLISSAILLYFSYRLIRRPTAEEAWTSFKVSSPYLAVILIALIISKIV